MFGRRDFEESSSSSFEAEDPGTPPPHYQQEVYRSSFDHEFELEPKPKTQFTTAQPIITRPESNPQSFQPVKKESNEKVGIFNHYEDPEPSQDRPVTANRPGSSSAQMRQKMMEAQKKKLMERPGPPTLVSTGGLLGSMKMESAPLGDALYSGPLLSEKDLTGNKGLKSFGNTGFTFEPNANKATFESLPGPIKADVRVIGREEVEEVRLDERTATKNEPSNILKEMQKKIEDSKHQPKTPETQAPLIEIQPRIIEVQPKPEIRAQEVSRPEVHQLEETKLEDQSQKAKEEIKVITETRRPDQNPKEEVKAAVPRPPPVNVREILSNEMRDMKKFLCNPLRKGILLQCSIRRDKSGFNRLFPKYFMQTSEGLNFLLAGKKRAGSRTSNYMVTMDQKDFNTKSSSFVGKVRSNFLGTEFMAYDAGLNPKRKGANPTNVRTELGVVLYESNIMGSKGPRKMHVIGPAVHESGDYSIWKPMNKNESMLAAYKDQRGNFSNMQIFFNKPPKWNEHVQAFVLNFNGRVDKASVKNFQLIDDKDENKVYLQFGRVGDQMFNLDFQWPFSPLLAFSIALTSFDNKFACE